MSTTLEPGHVIAIVSIVVAQGVVLGTMFVRAVVANAVLRQRVEELEKDAETYVLAESLAPQLAEIQHLAEAQAKETRELRTQIDAVRLEQARRAGGGRGG